MPKQRASAANFNITGPSTTAQTLGSGAGQTGTITDTGSLTVSGGTNAVTITGNNATLTNLGTLEQTGTGRAIRDNTGVTGLIVNNGSSTDATALMQAADGDVIQMNKSPASVTLNNYGTMTSLNASAGGSQVVDFNAILSGANTVNNFSGALMQASEADAVRPGVNGVVFNAGTIKSMTTTGSSSDGVDAQNNTGVQITNDTGGLIEGGRHGITGGAVDATVSFTMSVTNNSGATIQGDNGSGINIDGFNANEVVTVVNHGTITGNGHDIGDGADHDGDGVDVDGLVHLTNTGTIRSINAFSQPADGPAFSEGMSVGGGTIINSGTIEGSVAAGNTNAVGRGITLTGNDRPGGGRDPIYGDATVTNQAGGLIQGDSDAGIAVIGANASGHKVTIDNQAGATIKGGGTTAAAIDASNSFDSVTITNAGKIDGSSSGKALVLSQKQQQHGHDLRWRGFRSRRHGRRRRGRKQADFRHRRRKQLQLHRRRIELRQHRGHERRDKPVRFDRRTRDRGRGRPIVARRERIGRADRGRRDVQRGQRSRHRSRSGGRRE